MRKRKQKVTWDEDQIQHLIDSVCDLRIQDPEPSLLQLIIMTQDIIFKEEDRKVIRTRSHVEDIIEGVKKRFGVKGQEKIVKYVDKYKALEERVERIERILKVRKKLKIGLIGLKGNQFNEIERYVNELVDLTFIDQYQSKISLPTSIDYVIAATDFMKHTQTNQLHSFYPKEKIIEVDGTIHAIRKKINELRTIDPS